MLRKDNCVLVIGNENILHAGAFNIIDHESVLKFKKAIFVSDLKQLIWREPACKDGHYRLAVIFITMMDFFPVWFSLFLEVNEKAKGNILIFADSLQLVNKKRKDLLSRVADLEFLMHPAMPVEYIRHILQQKIDTEVRAKSNCEFSRRELKVLEAYVHAVPSAEQTRLFGVTLKTLYQHRKNCANKLGMRNLKSLLHM